MGLWNNKRRYLIALLFLTLTYEGYGQTTKPHSVARRWNEVLLDAIRNDFARPTVHARNLFHTSIALYDSWAFFDESAVPYLLGNKVRGFSCPCNDVPDPQNVKDAREEIMSYAAYRLLKHRFRNAPGKATSLPMFDQLMIELGYDTSNESEDYSTGSYAALGNYLSRCLIEYGLQDGSNEANDYDNQYYEPVNQPLQPYVSGSQGLLNPNRWQPLSFVTFEDQAGFETNDRSPDFVSPEWGKVTPFALKSSDLTIHYRNLNEYWVYHDPGEPAYIQQNGGKMTAEYQWGHSLVAIWSGHLDPADRVMWDISPGSIGNISEYPTTIEGLRGFYDLFDGGDPGVGHAINPSTGEPYPSQIVPRADYARVLAEFWSDGPDSETPPGHWFTILNYVSDHPDLEKKFKGEGDVLNDLEWDVKSYFVLAGAVHDAAISAWGIKGWYDYIRPICAIRYMADKGQSSNLNRSNYAPDGIPLEPGFIEMVNFGDPLAGANNENLGKIKLYAWKGPNYIIDPQSDVAGVDWILAEDWWPYQRPTFVTPPFAGYVSGHSTFSRAAAEVMTFLTGDEFFPGGVGEFVARKNEFLFFEEGPSVDVVLQWATYRDASDQTSLSRIWGGIHPPVDDIPGRLIGIEIGHDAFAFAEKYFSGDILTGISKKQTQSVMVNVYPNPTSEDELTVQLSDTNQKIRLQILSLDGKKIRDQKFDTVEGAFKVDIRKIPSGIYFLNVIATNLNVTKKVIIR